jgi:hypothetical protein
MPLFGLLGYRARHARFGAREARAFLETRAGTTVGLVLLLWAARRSVAWRELIETAREANASWCFLLAPPFLSLVDVRGHATRRSVDFVLPDVLHGESFSRFWTLANATTFMPVAPEINMASRIDALVEAAGRYQDRVREDLQHGVTDALRALGGVLGSPSAASRFDEASHSITDPVSLLRSRASSSLTQDPSTERRDAIGALCRIPLYSTRQQASERPGGDHAIVPPRLPDGRPHRRTVQRRLFALMRGAVALNAGIARQSRRQPIADRAVRAAPSHSIATRNRRTRRHQLPDLGAKSSARL